MSPEFEMFLESMWMDIAVELEVRAVATRNGHEIVCEEFRPTADPYRGRTCKWWVDGKEVPENDLERVIDGK
jgi:hypothetical protein